jgi:hypothetical protein
LAIATSLALSFSLSRLFGALVEIKTQFPPERLDNWKERCQILGTLSELRTLKTEMVIWTRYGLYDTVEPAENDIFSIFRAMLDKQAQTFDVEINFHLPSSLDAALGPRPFQITVQDRPYDWHAHPA